MLTSLVCKHSGLVWQLLINSYIEPKMPPVLHSSVSMSGPSSSDPANMCTFEIAGEMRERRSIFGHILVQHSRKETQDSCLYPVGQKLVTKPYLVANIALFWDV